MLKRISKIGEIEVEEIEDSWDLMIDFEGQFYYCYLSKFFDELKRPESYF